MQVKVKYTLSKMGRKEALRRGRSAKRKQTVYIDDPGKKTLDMPELHVDDKGGPYIELKRWGRGVEHWIEKPVETDSELDAPIETLEELINFCVEARNQKEEIERLLGRKGGEPLKPTPPLPVA